MRNDIILVGDTTSHGGTVISGSDADTVYGRPMARQGDRVDCPLHGINRIVEGDTATRLGDRPIALEGHRTECGAVLLGSGSGCVR